MDVLLSEHWHAVRLLRPRVREGVQVLHRRLRGKPWVLLHDPVTQRFHRVTPQLYRVLELLDGRRTLEEVWSAACELIEDAAGAKGGAGGEGGGGGAISQHELVQLLGSLYSNDLLQTQVSPDADEVFERYRRQQRNRLKQSWLNPLSLRLPLLYPDAWFGKQAALARLMFSWGTLVLWLLWVAPAAVLAWQHGSRLTENLSDRVLSAGNLVLLWFTYPLVKSIHEWAHGMAVKAWGGAVREIGVMFIVFTPVPYVDATASYRFPSKWARAAVAAAGIMAELAVGALAVYVWLTAESGLVTAVAFNVILIAGVSTVLVNGNPLMRYDGYFIASDLLEIPNLGQRATQYWTYLLDRYGFGARDAPPPLEAAGERRILFFYGAVAPVYRFAIMLGLIWFVASEYLFVGVVLALVGAWTALVMPLWRGWKHLSESPALARRREPALRRTLLFLGSAGALLAFIPLPFYSVHQAVVWLPEEAIVRAEAAGHTILSLVRPSQAVVPGEPVLVLDSPQVLADLGVAQAGLRQAQVQLRKAQTEDRVRAKALESEIASRQARLSEAQRRVEALTAVAASPGNWAPVAATELVGRYVKRGEVLGFVVGAPSSLVRAAVTQEDMALIHARLRQVEVRLVNDLHTPVAARVRRQVPGGEFDLVSAALGSDGGGAIPVDPSQQGGKRSLKRVFDLEIELARASRSSVFGDRAHVRFELGWAPLGWQWFLRLRQLFLSQLNV
jgi:putative peptide zinc metalloprotease protein